MDGCDRIGAVEENFCMTLSPRLVLGCLLVALLALPGAANAASITLFADLSPDNEVPPVASDGVGSASLIFDDQTRELTFAILFSDLTGDLTAAHIHDEVAGMNGLVVIDLEPLLPGGTLPTGAAGLLTGSTVVDVGLVPDLLDEGLYINLHTAINPLGEIRGQIQNATTQIPPVPEPALGVLLLAALGLTRLRLRR